MRVYLACFDIEDNANRRRVGNLLLTYGNRVQYSVFEITVKSPSVLAQIRRQCLRYLDDRDSLRFYLLTREGRQGSIDARGEPIAQFPAAVVL